MKTLFIPANSKLIVDKSKILEISKKLPKNIAIAYSIQYQNQAREIKSLLKSHNITSLTQVLGCSKPNFPKNTEAILLLSDGKFHAIALSFETKLPVFLFENNKLSEIPKEDINDLEKKQKVAYLKFLQADKVGILISTKPGQQNLKKALSLKKKLKEKQSYLFISNNINTSEFENFPEIQSWVNTACPRMDMNNSKIINISKLLQY